jgi:ABC-type nitrate/sulfonate/bicarbonate transport system permease component
MATPTNARTEPATPAAPTPGEAPRGPGLLRAHAYSLTAKLVMLLVILALWELVVRVWAPPFIARPTGVLLAIPGVVTSSEFLEAVAGTAVPIVQGLVIAIVLAILVGLAMGRVPWAEWALRMYVYALFALPMVALVPLMTMWLGYSNGTRLAIIIFAAFFPMALNVYDGARSVQKGYVEVAQSFRSSRRALWFGVVLPASMPYLLAGFRLASGRALVAAVVAEMLVALDGLGRFIQVGARSFRHDEAFVGVLALMLFGVGMLSAARWATAKFFPWYDQKR